MKTIHDYLNAMCRGGFLSPLITDDMKLSICAQMVCISVDMLYGGAY